MKILFSLLFLVFISASFSQIRTNGNNEAAPKVFLDCDYCDTEFLHKSIPFVNFIREITEADIVIQVLTQINGANGKDYSFDFLGRNKFSNLNDTLKMSTNITQSQQEAREQISNTIKSGLIRYIARTPLINKIKIELEGENDEKQQTSDNWDSWVFGLSTNGYLSGEKTSRSLNSWSDVSACRVTEDWKMNFDYSLSYSENKYNYDDVSILSISRSHYFTGSIVKSINTHWSAGLWGIINTSTYNNLSLGSSVAPAIEYNVFPYSESVRKILRMNYKIVPHYFKYTEETIYLKTEEWLVSQDAEIAFTYYLPWGNFSASVSGSNYLKDFSKNRLDFYTAFSVKLFKGLSANMSLNYSSVHNQLSLPKSNATLDEVILRRRLMETQYTYWCNFGLSYSFGSIYQNVVNPRFGV